MTREETNRAIRLLAQMVGEEAQDLQKAREQEEKTSCIECGRPLSDYEITEFSDGERVVTYKCACGCIAEQHYKLQYLGTEVLRERDI